MLNNVKVVDLTIPFGPDVVMWPGSPAPTAQIMGTVANDGFFARHVSFSEHSGTHFDAPSHFVEGESNVDQIPAASLVRPIALIDISNRIGDDADAVLTLEEVLAFEALHGAIPEGAAVFLRTGWEEKNSDPIAYAGQPGDLRFPGFGVEAAEYLVSTRKVVGLGIDTLGIDSGAASHFPVHSQVTHPKGLWHLENLQNLKLLPPVGAWVVVGVLPLVGGSGSPARVLALLP